MGEGAALLAILSLIGLAVGATGESTSPVADGFTGRASPGDCEDATGTFEIVGEVERWRGYACDDGWIGTSDPRFTGTYVHVLNLDAYRGQEFAPPEGAFNVWTIVRRVQNDEGAWQGEATTAAWVDDPDDFFVDDPPATVVFTGEGGYAGLTAIVTISERIVPSSVRGYIFAGSPPPEPSLAPG